MSFKDQFQLSKEVNPEKGYHLSKSECGFILVEMDDLVEKYQKELKDESMSPTLRRMTEHHLSGLVFITENIRKGFQG